MLLHVSIVSTASYVYTLRMYILCAIGPSVSYIVCCVLPHVVVLWALPSVTWALLLHTLYAVFCCMLCAMDTAVSYKVLVSLYCDKMNENLIIKYLS